MLENMDEIWLGGYNFKYLTQIELNIIDYLIRNIRKIHVEVVNGRAAHGSAEQRQKDIHNVAS